MATFTVDTHLFRELGELLVGRDSTALIELIKNSYDADATQVVVFGQDIGEHQKGTIRITDDGNGMSPDEFKNGFLRIASRVKNIGDRRSLRLNRRYTGEKGIGRLAAHKLARRVTIKSIRWDSDSTRERASVDATIDWDLVEARDTLAELEGTGAIVLEEDTVSPGTASGTTIILDRLRQSWSKREHARFLEEVQTFSPPEILTDPLPSAVLGEPLLFTRPTVRDVEDSSRSDFSVELEGDLSPPEDFWAAAAAAADWVIEIDASSESISYGVSPTERARRDLPDARTRTFEFEHPGKTDGPFFQSRILVRTGQFRGPKQQRMWATRNSGVRVYMEGFRVLPYGESGNDWLSLDRDVVERGRTVLSRTGGPLAQAFSEFDDESDLGLLVLPQKHYFGAVFLTQEGSQSLQMLVNREGFVPNASYDVLVDLIRAGIDLATRVRAAATEEIRHEKREKRKKGQQGDATKNQTPADEIRNSVEDVTSLASEARSLVSAGAVEEATEKVNEAVARMTEASNASEDMIKEASMLRVLASIGTQFAGFVHEINALLGSAQAIEEAMDKLRSDVEDREIRRRISKVYQAVGDLKRQLDRQASYLVDVVTPDARRRRSRQYISDRFETAARLVAHLAEREGIAIDNEIPEDMKSLPMFPAELTAVFANLLTNALKAAGPEGTIKASATQSRQGEITVRVENTGVSVDPEEGEQWFRPFESTTASVDAVLGQGMGLGLPITRTILEEYGAEISFVEPADGFATALVIRFPGV